MYIEETDESVIQAIWNEQDFQRELLLEDGRSLQVLNAGRWNCGPGPDFRGARLRLGEEEFHGDVELHFRSSDWFHHGHQNDPAYEKVILHVLWYPMGEKERRPDFPHLVMSRHSALDLEEAGETLHSSIYSTQQRYAPVEEARQLLNMNDQEIRGLLQQAGLQRYAQQKEHLAQRLVSHGLEQAAYEAVMEVCGFSRNKQTFHLLANEVKWKDLLEADSGLVRKALIWGASGLLPDSTLAPVHPQRIEEVRSLWQAWWPQRAEHVGEICWVRSGIRPSNFPERRLAAALHFFNNIDWAWHTHLEGMAPCSAREILKRSEKLFYLDAKADWCNFYNWKSPIKSPQQPLGAARVKDLVYHVTLPLLHLHGVLPVGNEAEVLSGLGVLQDNHLLKEAACRFFIPPSRLKVIVKHALHQQGLLHLLRQPECLTKLMP